MKYFVLVPDGAGDEKLEELGGKTPLEVANMPCADALAAEGEVGMVRTVPEGIAPGSDAANLSVMGYDPAIYLTGRSPLEAASIGIDMDDTDVAFRTNIITIKGDGAYEDMTIVDHSAGDITTAEAQQLIEALAAELSTEDIKFYPGVSYRHCMIMKNGRTDYELTPPHDVLGQRVGDHLPKGEGAEFITDMMKKSYEILKDHPVNLERIKKGLNPANTAWIWGQGKKPALSAFKEKYGLSGAAISAVDLIKGIAICAGLDSIDVEGATGTLHTNYDGKKDAAIKAFEEGKDFVYMHLEGPDECGHQADIDGKIEALEKIDELVLKPVVEYLKESGEDFKVLIVPDHRTPICIRTHSSTPVPYVIYRSDDVKEKDSSRGFNETAGEASGRFFEQGYEMADYFFAG